jgi:hypothetical protein
MQNRQNGGVKRVTFLIHLLHSIMIVDGGLRYFLHPLSLFFLKKVL